MQEGGFHGYPVISPQELWEKHKEAIVMITTSLHEAMITATLKAKGFCENQILRLSDYRPVMFSNKQYFDEAFISFQGEEEVFVDAGAYDLGSSVAMFRRNPHLKKIYAFEPGPNNYQVSIQNKEMLGLSMAEVLMAGTWSEDTTLGFAADGGAGSHIVEDESGMQIVARKIDSVVKEKVTFIKMDVEGSELESLKGAEQTIRRDKPTLAVCMYHKLEDMTELPLYIKSLVPEYKLYVRHYCRDARETVLYAVCR